MTRADGKEPLSPEEEWARRAVSHTLGVPVIQHDDNSQEGMYDLAITYPDGSVGAVEVTAAADPDSIELWRLLNGSSERWILADLAGGWIVSFDPTARAKRIFLELPTLLLQLEQAGTNELQTTHRFRHHPAYRSAVSLGIQHAFQSPETDYPGSIYCWIEQPRERTGGAIQSHSNAVAEWIGDYLTTERPKHVAKLGRSGCHERHAFVIVPSFATVSFAISDPLMRDNAPPPTDDPTLPDEVTHAWVVSTWNSGSGFRWSPDSGWQQFAKPIDRGKSET